MTVLREDERLALLKLIQSIYPTEDIVGVLLRTGTVRDLDGEIGAIRLAEKLDGTYSGQYEDEK